MHSFHQEVLERMAQINRPYLVGGAVRDTLLNRPTKDVDVVVEVSLEKLENSLREWGYHPLHIGAKHPTITLIEKSERIDFNPFDGDIMQDALRRDFTINAIYQDVRTAEYIDPLGGIKDLHNKILKACGDPGARFQEDPIRILRMVRFCVSYELEIEEKTLQAAKKYVGTLAGTAVERTSEEIGRILTLDNPETGIRLLDEVGYWQAFLPELARLKGLVQNRYHAKDAWEHTLHVVRNTPAKLILRLAGLFHDLGKWETASRECYAWGKCIAGNKGNKETKLEEFSLVGKHLQRWNGQYVEVHGARLDHFPHIIQVKHIRKSNSEKSGFEWVKDGKRHFLGHEKESGKLTRKILARFRFSMVLGNPNDGGEKELIWLIENHMKGTLAFMSEIRGEGKLEDLGEKARRFAWEQGWDGRDYRMGKLDNLLELWRADFFGGKQREPQDVEIFKKIQARIRVEAKGIITRSEEIDWRPLEEFAKGFGISGRKYGEFKAVLRTRIMMSENLIQLNEGFLKKEYNRYIRK